MVGSGYLFAYDRKVGPLSAIIASMHEVFCIFSIH